MSDIRDMVRPSVIALLACALPAQLTAQSQQHSRDGEIHDADTRAWWHTTEALSGDSMEGRDTCPCMKTP